VQALVGEFNASASCGPGNRPNLG